MKIKFLLSTACLFALCACAPGSKAVKQTEPQASSALPDRDETVSVLSNVYRFIRDTERATYNSMYSVRDGLDGMVYDAQKGYYEDYQK